MNIQQLKYIVEIEKQGSISKAAQALFISQPSLSSAIKDFEREVEITIFLRNTNGIKLTPEGVEIVKHAKSILQQVEDLMNVSENKNVATFRLSTENYSFAMDAFVHMCKLYDDDRKVNFTIKNENMMDVIDSIANFNSDIGVLLVNSSTSELCTSTLFSKNIEFYPIQRLSVNINLSKNHPLLAEDPFPFEKLNDYMFVRYANEKDRGISYMPELRSLNIINPNKTISVFDRELKCSIISQTTAFGIGCTLHPRFMSHFDMTMIPIPDNFATLGYIKLKNSILSEESRVFIKVLKEEFAAHREITLI